MLTQKAVRRSGKNGASSQICDIFIIPLEINFKEELLNPMENLQKDMSISLLPILCLLAGSLAVLLSVVAGILECSRRKYNVSNEVTHISFSNNLDLNPSNFDFFLTSTTFLTIFYSVANFGYGMGKNMGSKLPKLPTLTSKLLD